jgi:hypothetical protein
MSHKEQQKVRDEVEQQSLKHYISEAQQQNEVYFE